MFIKVYQRSLSLSGVQATASVIASRHCARFQMLRISHGKLVCLLRSFRTDESISVSLSGPLPITITAINIIIIILIPRASFGLSSLANVAINTPADATFSRSTTQHPCSSFFDGTMIVGFKSMLWKPSCQRPETLNSVVCCTQIYMTELSHVV